MKIVFLSLLAILSSIACSFGSSAPPTPASIVVATAIPRPDPTAIPSGPIVNPTGNPDMTEVTIEETLLNAQMSGAFPEGAQISNPRINIRPDNLAELTATINTGLIALTPTATVRASVRDGRISIEVVSIDVGGVGLPTALVEPQIAEIRRNAQERLNQQLAELERTTGLKLQSLTTTENALILRFAP